MNTDLLSVFVVPAIAIYDANLFVVVVAIQFWLILCINKLSIHFFVAASTIDISTETLFSVTLHAQFMHSKHRIANLHTKCYAHKESALIAMAANQNNTC